MVKPKPRVVYWFRTDLRLHDSPALKAALDLKPEVFYPIFTWDPHYVYQARGGPNRWQFLIDCQNDLSNSITKLNKRSKLFIIREGPQTLLPKLLKAWKITHLVFEKDTDAYAKDRDAQITKMAEKAGVIVISKSGRTLWDSDTLVEKNGGHPTMSISQLQAAGHKIGEIVKPIDAPTSLPDPGDLRLDFKPTAPDRKKDWNAHHRPGGTKSESSYKQLAGPKGDYGVESLEELGMEAATTPHRGGETIALKMLADVIKDEKYTATFAKPNTAPTAFQPQATTLLSPHLHFGSLSVRKFYWDVRGVVDNYKGETTKPPTSLTGQLLFRDMYFAAQAALGHSYAQMLNNPTCKFLPWHLPTIYDEKTGLTTGKYSIDSEEADQWFCRWKYGITGFPWIDALMRQLKQEGWIHHLGRHSVACFLTRGGCYIDWERGAEVFEMWLLDHEVACNVGNWQWLSCTAFFSQYYRVYGPTSFPKKWDKTGNFVRHYVPELANFGDKFIYEPWKAPIADQKKWGCIVKGNGIEKVESDHKVYPKPMFDFNERKTICIEGMKQAYKVNLHGNDAQVKDGTWRKLFDKNGEGPVAASGAPGAVVDGAEVGVMESDDDLHHAEFDHESGPKSPKSPKATKKGTKREAGQTTLDATFRKRTRA